MGSVLKIKRWIWPFWREGVASSDYHARPPDQSSNTRQHADADDDADEEHYADDNDANQQPG